MSRTSRLGGVLALILSASPAPAQTSPGLPPIPSVTNPAQAAAILRARDEFCGPHFALTPNLARYDRPFFCTCMGAQLSAARTANMTVSTPMLTKMATDCVGLSHRNTAAGAKPLQQGSWVEMGQGPQGGPTLGWGEPGTDLPLYAFWLTCQPASGTLVLTVELAHGRPGQPARVWLSKGLRRNLLIIGTVRRGPSGPVLAGSFAAPGILDMLGQPEDLVLHAPEAPTRFPNASLAAPLRTFTEACARH